MKVKVYLIIIIILCGAGLYNVSAQSRNGLYGFTEPGTSSIVLTGLGPGYLFGDLGGTINNSLLKDFEFERAKIMLSLNYRYMFPNNIGFKINALYGRFEHADEGSRNDVRDYNSDVKLGILATHFEYNLFGGEYAQFPSPHTFYVFAGIGVLYSDSKIWTLDKTINQQFLGKHIISNDGKNAHTYTITPVVPIGFGYEYEVTSNWAVGAEYNLHIPFSDYVDGLSPSGSKSKDYLMSLSMTLTYKFGYRPSSSNRVIWN